MLGKRKLGKLKNKISEAKKISIQKKCNIIITKYKNNFTRKISSRHAIDNEESMKLYYNKLTKKIRILESYNKKLALVKRTTLINFYISLRDSKYIALKRESEKYWNKNPNEKKEYDETIRKFYIDLAWDISGFKDISTSMADLAIHWTGVIKKDPELIKLGGDELKGDLALLAGTISPSKKFRKMVEIEKKLKILKLVQKLKGVKGFKDYNNHYSKHGNKLGYNTSREYEKAAINFMKNKEGKDFMVWVRTYDRSGVKKNDIFKINVKTGTLGIIDKNGNITTFHKSDDFLKNSQQYLKNNKN